MRASLLVAVGVLLAAAPAGAQQDGPPPQQGAEMLERREQQPFDRLMAVRGELALSDAQVARLQAIAARLEETNRPVRQELLRRWQAIREERREALMRMTPEQRQAELRRVREQGPPPVPPRLRPLVQQMRRNIAGAMREVGGVLTPAQKARVRELVRERREMGPGMRRGGRPGLGARRPRARA